MWILLFTSEIKLKPVYFQESALKSVLTSSSSLSHTLVQSQFSKLEATPAQQISHMHSLSLCVAPQGRPGICTCQTRGFGGLSMCGPWQRFSLSNSSRLWISCFNSFSRISIFFFLPDEYKPVCKRTRAYGHHEKTVVPSVILS